MQGAGSIIRWMKKYHAHNATGSGNEPISTAESGVGESHWALLRFPLFFRCKLSARQFPQCSSKGRAQTKCPLRLHQEAKAMGRRQAWALLGWLWFNPILEGAGFEPAMLGISILDLDSRCRETPTTRWGQVSGASHCVLSCKGFSKQEEEETELGTGSLNSLGFSLPGFVQGARLPSSIAGAHNWIPWQGTSTHIGSTC